MYVDLKEDLRRNFVSSSSRLHLFPGDGFIMAVKRDRGSKDVSLMADRLEDIAVTSKSFTKYHDCEFDELPGVSVKTKGMLERTLPVVFALRTMSMDKKVSIALTTELAKTHTKTWKLKEELRSDWITVMARRIRNAIHDNCRCVRNKAPWAVAAKMKMDKTDGNDDDDTDDSYAYHEELAFSPPHP